VIEALASHAPEEALAGGVRPRCPDGGAQHRDPAARRDAGERGAVLAIVVADEEARGGAEGRRLAELLRDPGIRGVARDADVDDPARPEFDDAEREECAEPQVDDLEEIAGPGLVGVVPQERRPGLPTPAGPLRPGRAHMALDRALAHPDSELPQLPANPLRAPQPVFGRQAPDGRDRLRRHLRALRRGGQLDAPDQPEALPVPAQQRVRLHDEERGAPPARQARQEDEAEAVRRGEHRPLDLASEDRELLAEEGVLGDQRELRPGQIADGTTDARSGRGLGPREEATVGRA